MNFNLKALNLHIVFIQGKEMDFKISPDEVPYILASVKTDSDFLKVKLLGDDIHIVTINKSQILYYEIEE